MKRKRHTRTPRLARLDEERSALVAQWSGLIAWAVNRYPKAKEKMGDLAESIAGEALVDAARMYDPAIGKFSTFASKIMWSALQRETERDGVIRRKSGARYGHPPIRIIPIQHQADRYDLAFQLAAPEEVIAVEADEMEFLRESVSHLTPRQALVIRLRFFEGQSLTQVAAVIGLSKEMVRQIQLKAIKKLKELMVPEEEVRANGTRS